MPDVIIWMISGSTRIAYTRIPAYDIMYSSNPAAKGRNCAKLQNFLLKVRFCFSQGCTCLYTADNSNSTNNCYFFMVRII